MGKPFFLLLTFLMLLVSTGTYAADNGDVPVNTVASARRMITDLLTTYGEKYPQGEQFLERLEAIEKKKKESEGKKENEGSLAVKKELAELIRVAALANPLLHFDELLVIRRKGEANRVLNSRTNTGIKLRGWDNDISAIAGLTSGKPTRRTLYKTPDRSVIKQLVLHWDGKRIMFSGLGKNGRWAIREFNAETQTLRELTPSDQPDVDWFDGCYLPEENAILSASTASVQGLPCTDGMKKMVNLYRVNSATRQVKQLTFEQDSDWHPTVRSDGRVMYLRWEYIDTPHYFSRYLFTMNPDGSGQRELWGSGSYFPAAFCYPKECPDGSGLVVGVASGNHSKSETGRLLLVNPQTKRKYPFRYDPPSKEWGKEGAEMDIHPQVLPAEQTGCVQEIPGWERDVVGNVRDAQGNDQTYTFGTPWPLSSKYFLVSMRGAPGQGDNWAVCLVDVFDNITLLYEDPDYDCFEPVPFVASKQPPVLPSRLRKEEPTTVYCADVYAGRAMEKVPRGTVQRMRIYAYHFCYPGTGGHESVGLNSTWDIRRILGEIPVEQDGSFSFKAPPNTPIAFQPLDEDGAAVALMRSWVALQPGESLSCYGCHEEHTTLAAPVTETLGRATPREIEPWYGKPRPFGFYTEIQVPVLEKYCVKCHNDKRAAKEKLPSFEKSSENNWRTDLSYLNLAAYIHRSGPEGPLDILNPMEYHSSTSPLIQMLRKGHYGVELDDEAWRRLYCWIDFNAPHRGMWNAAAHEKRRLELAKLYGAASVNPEEEFRRSLASTKLRREAMPKEAQEEVPKKIPALQPLTLPAIEVKRGEEITLPLADDVTMNLVSIPTGEFVMGSQSGFPDEAPRSIQKITKPFYIGTTEVTNAQYKAFDPKHDTGYIDEDGKDHVTPGYIANHRNQPVARVSWDEANAFCAWLSKKTGKKVRLPTEKEWEWAARAGSDEQFFYGDKDVDFSPFANLADSERRRTWNLGFRGSRIHTRRNYPADYRYPLRDDRWKDNWFVVDYVSQCKPNACGLYDVVGNVSEWTASDYLPYPYTEKSNSGDPKKKKVARGGAWNDRPKEAGSSTRFSYEPWQKVYNVGFRVVVEK